MSIEVILDIGDIFTARCPRCVRLLNTPYDVIQHFTQDHQVYLHPGHPFIMWLRSITSELDNLWLQFQREQAIKKAQSGEN